MTEEHRLSIKRQLQEQICLMKSVTLPYIGRINHTELHVFFGHGPEEKWIGPFKNRAPYDLYCFKRRCQLDGQNSSIWSKALWKCLHGPKEFWLQLKRSVPALQKRRFVLTHVDLSPRNILVEDSTITGIVDWEFSGFYPEDMELGLFLAVMKADEGWMDILREMLPTVSERRVEELMEMRFSR